MSDNNILLFLFSSLLLVVPLLLFSCILLFSISEGSDGKDIENSIHQDNLSGMSTTLKKDYVFPKIGLHISLPSGWTGINHENFAMISPAKMNERTGLLGDKGDKVVMTFEVLNRSDHLYGKHSNISETWCNILHKKTVKINGIQGQETLRQCGNTHTEKIDNYKFIVGDWDVIVGLKGNGSNFDDNLDIFTESINTIKIASISQKTTRNN